MSTFCKAQLYEAGLEAGHSDSYQLQRQTEISTRGLLSLLGQCWPGSIAPPPPFEKHCSRIGDGSVELCISPSGPQFPPSGLRGEKGHFCFFCYLGPGDHNFLSFFGRGLGRVLVVRFPRLYRRRKVGEVEELYWAVLGFHSS